MLVFVSEEDYVPDNIPAEPTGKDASFFRDEVLPKLVTKETELFEYYRDSSKRILAVTDITVPNGGLNSLGYIAITMNSDMYYADINDISMLYTTILKDSVIFMCSLLLIIPIVWYLFFRVSNWAVKPIKLLNRKMRQTNSLELNTANTEAIITSKEAKELFTCFKDIVITRGFTLNLFFDQED